MYEESVNLRWGDGGWGDGEARGQGEIGRQGDNYQLPITNAQCPMPNP